ncbi:4-alpha-glucanotransferase [Sansalvadorimonas verongulae]|uniref:4-alpha-glucanotransferase n=1 Tax=Sansalvadorimonas verongulae TaxID=2172824 RepID=UPI0012BD4901|nr:4-alpha-glucanotransferase [Sansalvadorimonas verongulae]MTI13928.1 4-alpha-glucanotransferase [Sansalvadorimonas verongulae]
MSYQEQVEQLANLYGVPSGYIDANGADTEIQTQARVCALNALGLDIKTASKVERAIERFLDQNWSQLIPPVIVQHKGKPFTIPIHLPASRLTDTLKGSITLDNKKAIPLEFKLKELPVLETRATRKKDMAKLNLPLPDISPGYHQLTLTHRKKEYQCRLIITPSTCYEPDFFDEKCNGNTKIWGCSIQLYTLRSDQNWGIGDFSDLKALAVHLAAQGADVIGLNPIHALFPDNPEHCSPYSPSTKSFINPLYIDVMAIPEFLESTEIQDKVRQESFQSQLKKLQNSDHVDYSQTTELKYTLFRELFAFFQDHHAASKSERFKTFEKFRKSGGANLECYAIYNALYEHFKKEDPDSWGWPFWPKEYQSPEGSKIKSFQRKNKDKIHFYIYLQWLAETQLMEAQQAALKAGMKIGIYRDLAVGVDKNGADVWSQPEGYCLQAGIGAPPDPVAPQGQNWGLPPLNPIVLRGNLYTPFIDTVQSNMASCGALRIDHVMGLLRQWWCPQGGHASDGAYVNFPFQDLLGILKLESHRHKCLVFGEDLGTVPEEIESSLPPAHCYSTKVLMFSNMGEQFKSPEDYKKRALTCISNHDIPTLKAWWQCDDLDLRQQLGIYDSGKTLTEKKARHKEKIALLKTLGDIDEWPWGVDPNDITTLGYSRDLMEKIHYYLAKTASRIVTVQLEDLLEMTTPVNVPGTSDEYPNWKRKLSRTLSDIFEDQGHQAFFKNLTLTRQA